MANVWTQASTDGSPVTARDSRDKFDGYIKVHILKSGIIWAEYRDFLSFWIFSLKMTILAKNHENDK